MAITRCHCAALVVSSAGTIKLMPALFTRPSSAPWSARDSIRQLLHEWFGGNISRHTLDLRALISQSSHLRIDRLDVQENHPVLALRQQGRRRKSDTLRGARDQYRFFGRRHSGACFGCISRQICTA